MEAELSFALTGDGSRTLYNPRVGEHYHSRHGALTESRHVFVESGLQFHLNKNGASTLSILEVGFGTGLNFLLSAEAARNGAVGLTYTGIEAFPLDLGHIRGTGYQEYLPPDLWDAYLAAYESALTTNKEVYPGLDLQILHTELRNFESRQRFDVIYFDAFAAVHQPEMWTYESLERICQHLISGGTFVTYAITGELKRNMRSLGFSIEKAPGAPGKREMLRAVKLERS